LQEARRFRRARKQKDVGEMATNIEPQANPAAAGLAGFGVTTVLLSLINAAILPPGGESVVLPLALAYGGLIQLIAGLLEFRTGNTFGTTVFLSYGAFWWWFALLLILGNNGVLNLEKAGSTIGVALLLWAIVSTCFWAATFRLTRAIWALLLLVALTFYLLAFGNLLAAPGLTVLGGWAGLAAGILALYCSLAIVVNATFARPLLPLGLMPIIA